MRIDTLVIQNFKKFSALTIDLHPQFTLLVGDNATGKTTILDALAVALGVWLVEPPDTMLQNSRRNILDKEIRLLSERRGDRTQFQQARPVSIQVTGLIGDHSVTWTRQISTTGNRTSNGQAQAALALIRDYYDRVRQGQQILCPVLAYYGAGRGWLPSRERSGPASSGDGPARRWAAFYDCFNERIRFAELTRWFQRETTEAGNRQGRMRPGFEAVRRAILRCVPDSDEVRFSSDLNQIVLSIQGRDQPFDNLSAGQRMMLALVADIAIKIVTQNAHLLPEDELPPLAVEPLPQVLAQTPGVVLIDELDVHLHPSWQRRVARDLKRTFPALQFVCTSHSAQVVGELSRQEIRLLRDSQIEQPLVAIGADSNWILDHVMDPAASENSRARALRDQVEAALDEGALPKAREALAALHDFMEQGLTSQTVGLESRLSALEALAADGEAPEDQGAS